VTSTRPIVEIEVCGYCLAEGQIVPLQKEDKDDLGAIRCHRCGNLLGLDCIRDKRDR
jgi:hypothetical protein